MSQKKPKKAFKRFLAGVVMTLLGKGIVCAYRRDSRAKADIDSLGDNCSVKLLVQPVGPALLFGKKDGEIFSRKCAVSEPADITLAFKGVEGAILMFTARLGLSEGYAQHRFIVLGDLYKVMSIVRVMNIVEAYLFPKFIAKKLMNPVPKREINMLRFYGGTLFGK